MKNILKCIILCLLLLISSCKNKKEIESQLEMEIDTSGIEFKFANFNKAIEKAKEIDKHILIYVTSDGCFPCMKMQKEVFTNPKVYEFFNKEMVCAKIHFKRTGSVMKSSEFKKLNETRIDFLDFHNVDKAFPTFLIFDNNGKLINKTAKYMNIEEFLKFGKKNIK